ncbi:MAG: hypothetical protein P3X23_002710 [Thermosynechococcus sp. Uc]|uniref:hypothetical protein n=1 Tax=Thermosynechococcus sp. Uc TaxID=3034853 RepID=UPI00259E403C|nr:hypothetical protein [Thermosynechococcus sp. Uc]MDM7326020.1 hypothetical protein [Thermosynechococcus sp. Uc]
MGTWISIETDSEPEKIWLKGTGIHTSAELKWQKDQSFGKAGENLGESGENSKNKVPVQVQILLMEIYSRRAKIFLAWEWPRSLWKAGDRPSE